MGVMWQLMGRVSPGRWGGFVFSWVITQVSARAMRGASERRMMTAMVVGV